MPDNSIMDFVDNEESLYNRKLEVFDHWMAEGDAWRKPVAKARSLFLADRFAKDLKDMGLIRGRYKDSDLLQFAEEMVAEFEEYREDTIQAIVQRTTRTPGTEDLAMDAGDIEHAEKYEGVAQHIGIDFLKGLIPATPERIRKALEQGDKHLNTIPLRKWDAATAHIGGDLSLSEKVCALKHVAKWHYA